MENIKGKDKDLSFLKELVKIGDLVNFDGPLLSLFRDEKDSLYLYHWVDNDEKSNRWIVAKTSLFFIKGYLKQEISHWNLIIKSPERYLFLVDLDHELNPINQLQISKGALSSSKDYLPAQDVFHESEDCPHEEIITDYIYATIKKKEKIKSDNWKDKFPLIKKHLSKIFTLQEDISMHGFYGKNLI